MKSLTGGTLAKIITDSWDRLTEEKRTEVATLLINQLDPGLAYELLVSRYSEAIDKLREKVSGPKADFANVDLADLSLGAGDVLNKSDFAIYIAGDRWLNGWVTPKHIYFYLMEGSFKKCSVQYVTFNWDQIDTIIATIKSLPIDEEKKEAGVLPSEEEYFAALLPQAISTNRIVTTGRRTAAALDTILEKLE